MEQDSQDFLSIHDVEMRSIHEHVHVSNSFLLLLVRHLLLVAMHLFLVASCYYMSMMFILLYSALRHPLLLHLSKRLRLEIGLASGMVGYIMCLVHTDCKYSNNFDPMNKKDKQVRELYLLPRMKGTSKCQSL